MNLEKIISATIKKKLTTISKEELEELLLLSKIIIEKDTYFSDKIRLLRLKNNLIIQEKSTKAEFIIRIMNTKEEAESFINQRLEIYNRMWDGCGCRVDYYN